jgi:sugar-specific transcriptional regulator TrmB
VVFDVTQLEHIGLTQNESKTYLALLELGVSKTGDILTRSQLNSGKIYEVLESLKRKGLVSETTVDGIRHFAAAPPQQLKSYLEQKKQALGQEEKEITALIPLLSAIRAQGTPRKRISTYTTFRGIITAAEEALEHMQGKEILSLGISDKNAWSQSYWNKWEKLRMKKGITARYILSEKGTIYRDLQKVKNINVRILAADTPVGIDIYGSDTILLLHYQEPVACTLIVDEHAVTTFRAYFELLWKQAK